MTPFPLRWSVLFATVFGIGFSPIAPGTAGTLVGLAVFWLLRPEITTHLILLAFVVVIGTIACHFAEKAFGTKDSGQIVIDEVAGYFATMLFLPMTPGYLIAGFFLFRLFDIIKPPPVRQVERGFSGGVGVMADDLAAGVYANLCMQLWRMI